MSHFFLRLGIPAWSRLHPPSAARWLADRFLTPTGKRDDGPYKMGRRDLPDGGVLWSDIGDGRPALLLHGWSGHRDQLTLLADILRTEGYVVHLLDPPAHGAAEGLRSNPARFVQAVRDAAKVAGHFDIAVGHSMGGAALMHLACGERPDLARALLILSAPHGMKHPIQATARRAAFGQTAACRFQVEVARAVGIPVDGFDVLPRATAAKSSLTLVHDPADPQIPFAHAEELAYVWPGARLIATADAGHTRTPSAPEARSAILELVSLNRKAMP